VNAGVAERGKPLAEVDQSRDELQPAQDGQPPAEGGFGLEATRDDLASGAVSPLPEGGPELRHLRGLQPRRPAQVVDTTPELGAAARRWSEHHREDFPFQETHGEAVAEVGHVADHAADHVASREQEVEDVACVCHRLRRVVPGAERPLDQLERVVAARGVRELLDQPKHAGLEVLAHVHLERRRLGRCVAEELLELCHVRVRLERGEPRVRGAVSVCGQGRVGDVAHRIRFEHLPQTRVEIDRLVHQVVRVADAALRGVAHEELDELVQSARGGEELHRAAGGVPQSLVHAV
jgi:hypothetical protein